MYNKPMASLPTQQRIRVDQLETDEYFGGAFAKGRANAALFCQVPSMFSKSEKTKYRIVWTYGKWSSFAKVGDVRHFFHTQSGAQSHDWTMIGCSDDRTSDEWNAVLETAGNYGKVPQWTLK